MKILIVKYLPSGQESNTLKLLDKFKLFVGKHIVDELDLIQTPPKLHDETSLLAYKMRNFGGQELPDNLASAIAPMDEMAKQFAKADMIVLATPMHNFSLPAAVKAYFDAVMQSGLTFKYENNEQIGLMNKSKFLTLYTSMGSYKDEYGFLDNLKVIAKIELDFLGFKDYEFVHAATGNQFTIDNHMQNAKNRIEEIVTKWSIK